MKKARGWRSAGLWPSVSGGAFQKRGLSWQALYCSAVVSLPFLIDIRRRAIRRRGEPPVLIDTRSGAIRRSWDGAAGGIALCL